jgi:hypothetical protein
VAWTREDLAALPPSVDAVAVKIADPEDEDLRRLATLKNLEVVSIEEAGRITRDGLRALATLPRLKALTCRLDRPEAIAGLTALADCRTLTDLDLSSRESLMSDEGFRALAKIESLARLDVSGCGTATDDGIRALSRLTRLKSLYLGWSERITGTGFEALAAIPNLDRIDLTGAALTPEGAAALARLPALRRLRLLHAGIGDDHLRNLAACRNLQDLMVHRDNRDSVTVTDAGVDALRPLQQLRWFRLTGFSVSEAAFRRLAESMPASCYVRQPAPK